MSYGYGLGYGYSYGLSDPTSLLVPVDQLLPLSLSSKAGASPLPLGDRGLTESGKLEAGALSPGAPVSPFTVKDGNKLLGFFEDFYDRIYIEPHRVDFGLFPTTRNATVNIWNAYLSEVTLDSIDTLSLLEDNVAVSAGTLPRAVPPLGTIQLTATATAAGPMYIDGSIELSFSEGTEATLPVTGIRARLFPFVPNWANPWTETIEFRTEIIKSRSGREQRTAVRSVPRKNVEYTVSVYGENREQLDRRLDSSQHLEYALADQPRQVQTVTPVSGATVEIASAPDWLEEGMLVAIVSKQRTALKYVQHVAGTTLTFNDSDSEDWPAGSAIHPVLLGFLDNSIATRRLTSDVAEASIRFGTNPGRQEYEEPDASPHTFNGKDLFLLQPNWVESPSVEYSRDTETVDYGFGVIARHDPVKYGRRLTRLLYTNRSVADARTLRSLFLRCKGQRGEFYMPTGERDMRMAQPAPNGTSSIRVAGTGIFDNYLNSSVFRAIYLQKKDGTAYPRRVVSMFTVNDIHGHDTILQLATSWPEEITPGEVDKISWLPCRRFATDSLTIEWLTSTVSRSQITVQTIEDFPAE